MMLVTLSLEYCRTRFHTLITSPQVVSTSTQPFSSSRLRVPTSVPNAGIITTSPAFRRVISSSVGLGEIIDAHVADLVVDLGVVNDFAEQVNGFFGRKIFSRGIGKVNRALDAVAKAEFLRELHREAVRGKHATVGADAFD